MVAYPGTFHRGSRNDNAKRGPEYREGPAVPSGGAVALAGFRAVTFVVCVAWDARFPQWAMRSIRAALLPGFEWLSIASLLLGLTETVIYGFWLALVVPLGEGTSRLFDNPDEAARRP